MTGTGSITYSRQFIDVTDAQVAGWRVITPTGDRLPTLTGDCPTCMDGCEVPIVDEVVQGGTPSAASGAAEPVLTRVITCNCLKEHQQPAGVQAGCGSYWLGSLTLASDGSYELTVERNLRLLPAATALREALDGQDKRIQAAAEKWLGGVTAIYALFSLSGVATAKDALAGLDVTSRILVAGAFLLGLISAGVALVFGHLAAYQWPRPIEVDTNEKLTAWYLRYRGYAGAAATRLQWAVFLAFGSLAALTVVMLLVWFLPRQLVAP